MNPIVGIGELLWDVFPDGRKVAGGAPFNFAFHCRQLGHEAVIVSRVGADDLGRELRDEVRRLGLSDEYIQTDPDHPTGTVRVTVDESGQPSYMVAEDVAWDHISWDAKLDAVADRAVAVCHGTLVLRSPTSRRTAVRLVDESRRGVLPSIRVFDVNLRMPTLSPELLREGVLGADWVKVSGDEWGVVGKAFDMPCPGVLRWHQQHGAGADSVWLITRGAVGSEVFTPKLAHREPGVPARVVDTVGAGDAFTAAMVCLHLEGRPLRDCARFANHYAARVCEHRGATPRVDRAEVERAAFGPVS